jgi:hypothetical protein
MKLPPMIRQGPVRLVPSWIELVGWVLFAGFALAILGLSYASGSTFDYGDEREYAELARNLASGNGYVLQGQHTAFRPPAWVLILAPAAAIGASNQVLSLIPAICLIIAALLAARLGSSILGYPWGLLVGFAVLLYPLNVYTATTLYPQTFTLALLMWLWVLMAKLNTSSDLPMLLALLSGVACAAMTLAAPTMIFSSVAVLAWLWFRSQHRLRFLVVAGLGFVLPILAWTIRNLVSLGSAVIISTSGGLNLLLGNNPNATPSSGIRADISAYGAHADALGMTEIARDRFYTRSALEWIHDNPARAAELYLGKLANYFSAYNEPATSGQGSTIKLLVAWTAFAVVVVLVVVRILLARRGDLPLTAPETFMLFLFIMNGPFMAIFFTRTRFRQPLDSILVVEAALAVSALLIAVIRKRTPSEEDLDKAAPGQLVRGPLPGLFPRTDPVNADLDES